jgi:hypothetical protein
VRPLLHHNRPQGYAPVVQVHERHAESAANYNCSPTQILLVVRLNDKGLTAAYRSRPDSAYRILEWRQCATSCRDETRQAFLLRTQPVNSP